MNEFILTTVLEFADGGLEGQVLHMGDKGSCEKVQSIIPAVSYSGDRKITRAATLIVERPDENWKTGQFWRNAPRPAAGTEAE